MSHLDRVKGAFACQAGQFSDPRLTLAREEYLRWMVLALDPKPDWTVLDVAAGTGHLGRALASRVREVVALDVTPAMLEKGRQAARESGISNITFREGAAECLPFPENAFDLVTCRFAFHHFENPALCLQEMIRAARRDGRVAVIDLLAPENDALAENYNRLERLRDPSHTRAFQLSELKSLFAEAGLSIEKCESRTVEVNVNAWLELTKTPEPVGRSIRDDLSRDSERQDRTGFFPFAREGVLWFKQEWGVLSGYRPQTPMHEPVLRFEPVDFDAHSDICVKFRVDSYMCSFGTADQFHGPDGKGAGRYLDTKRQRMLEMPGSCVHVWMGDEIIGQLEMSRFKDDSSVGYVNLYYLAPALRNRGWGRWLDEYATDYLRRQGFQTARLSVSPTNSQAIRFYLKNGWKDLGPRPGRSEVRLMERALA